jgi:hypothetical protein
MKKLIFSAVFAISFAMSAFAINPNNVDDKVLKSFNETFAGATQVSWTQVANHYEAFFISGDVKTRALLDHKGRILQTIRYYGKELLPASVADAVTENYKNKEIFAITEVQNKYGTNYRIVLKDQKQYLHLNANSKGDIEVAKVFNRGDQ